MKKQKKTRYFLCGLLILGLMLAGGPKLRAEAAGNVPENQPQDRDYTYQAVFHAGGQGSFKGTEQVQVASAGETGNLEIALSEDKKTITVTGLQAGDRISFDAAQKESGKEGESTLAIQLENESRYYVKGIRKSGRDGRDPMDTVLPSEGVEGDLDYVVSYGIRGDMTTYTVYYQDTSGRNLASKRTYSGNVGDRPVAAYVYVAGYQPQAYNLTQVLVKNEAENIFTFIYTPVSAGGTGGESPGGVIVEETVETVTVPGGAAPAAAAPGGGAEAPAGGGGEEIPDEEIPEGPPELLDLDDEEIPLASGGEEGPEGSENREGIGTKIFYGLAAVAAVGAGSLAGAAVWLWKRKKKKKTKGKTEPKEPS